MVIKILILLGDAGGGHMSAAKATAEGLEALHADIEAKIINLSDTEKSFPFNATDNSWKLVSKYPIAQTISNQIYKLINTKIGDYIARKFVQRFGANAVRKVIEREDPQIVISTHFVVSAVLEKMKQEMPQLFTVSIAADLVGFPRLLADSNADLIFCATAKAAKRLESFGIKPNVIKYPHFPLAVSKGGRQIEVDANQKCILVTGGGVGTIALVDEIGELLKLPKATVIVICGKSEDAYQLLQDRYRDYPNLRLEKFVNNMNDFLTAADLVIAKPGPATIVEIELLKRKAIFTQIIGKQEFGNIAYLKQNPNFVYLPEEKESVSKLALQLMSRPYRPFEPRFNKEANRQLANVVMKSYTASPKPL